ncbi:hypothetical protein GBF38_014603, partial [Nibea albiflora]
VRNGIIAEDAQTIEDQMQLPVQTALPDDLQPGVDDEAEAVLIALEAQEDLGSGEDLLAVPQAELQLELVAPAEPAPEPAAPEAAAPEAAAPEAATPAEATTEPEAAIEVVEALPPVEEATAVETVVVEAVCEPEAIVEATEDAPAAESVVTVQAEAPAVVEEVANVPAEASSEATPAVEPVVLEPAEAPVVVEEAAAAVVAEAPAEVATPVDTEAPTDNVAAITASAAAC